MHLIIFSILIFILFVAVNIGAVAFELTGLAAKVARFQSISCFTGTGFTTRESELVVGNHQRRRIAAVLMIMGYAGFASLIATFVNTLKVPEYIDRIHIPFIDFGFRADLLPWVNLAFIFLVTYLIYIFFVNSKLAVSLNEKLRVYLVKRKIFSPVLMEELMAKPGGYSIANIEIFDGSPVVNKTIGELNLKTNDVSVLALNRGDKIISCDPGVKLLLNDSVICYGKTDNIRKSFGKTI